MESAMNWWMMIVGAYAISMGVMALKDRWVKLRRLWILPIAIIGIKSAKFVASPIVMSLGLGLGSVLGLWYAKRVPIKWRKRGQREVWIPGGQTTLVVMLSFVLVKSVTGVLMARGGLDAGLWSTVDAGVGAVFTGYNVAKVTNWTLRSMRSSVQKSL